MFELKELQSAGRAFGYGPNACECEIKSGVRKLPKSLGVCWSGVEFQQSLS